MKVELEIPRERRDQVERRDLYRCVRCGNGGADWHHRRSRRRRNQHTHCSCNGVLLCRTCHRWVHDHPMSSMDAGLIVLTSVDEPGFVPLKTFTGLWILDCMGGGSPAPE